MKTLIAIDSFKGSMTSTEAGCAAAAGVRLVYPDADICIKPVADGGEGTVEAIVKGQNGELKNVTVTDPLGRKITAQYGIVGNTAVIEMAAASGIALVKADELNPMEATSYGTGEMIKDAILSGCRNFIIGIGGSATNDGGIGMLQALGFKFLNIEEKHVPFGAKALEMIYKIDDDGIELPLKECSFNIACDVTNPLCGENGCSNIFAPQKGADAETVKIMEKGMEHYAQITSRKYKKDNANCFGAGAAGGMGFAFLSYLNGKMQSGIKLILEQIRLEECIKDADLVITGEGKIDAQTVMGKAPIGIAELAKKYNIPVLAFSGCVSSDAKVCNKHGIDAIFSIIRSACSIEEAMDNENARKNMTDCVEQAMRLWKLKI